MGFNNGFEHVRLENKWKKLRIQYREAGMSEEAIQEMYNFDVQVVNSEQRYYRHSKDLAFNDADTEDTHSNDRYTGLTMQQEALFFAEQNGHAAPLTAGIKLRAKVVGEDALSMAFLAATNRVGLDFNYDSLQLSDYRISCVGTALKLYNQMGEKIYCEALRLIVDAWEGKPDSFRAAVLKGVMYFVEVYHGEFNEERLIRALRSVHPMEIYRTGMDNPAKLPGWKKYVFPIYAAYNGKSRKDALPMKF